jgi:hypothetical protein
MRDYDGTQSLQYIMLMPMTANGNVPTYAANTELQREHRFPGNLKFSIHCKVLIAPELHGHTSHFSPLLFEKHMKFCL